MTDFLVLHSTLSGKGTMEEKRKKIFQLLEAALDIRETAAEKMVAFTSSRDELKAAINEMIQKRIPKVAISGGDGFASLFFNMFFAQKVALATEDYSPDILFIAGGTGNAVAYCTRFKNSVEALKSFYVNEYKTLKVNLLEVDMGGKKELSQFVSFGADGEILDIYRKQKLKGIWGYILSVIKYSFGRKLYNIFSKNDANYNLRIVKNGDEIHNGRHEGGGISSIPFLGYGFRAFPLATDGRAHIRFVLFGAYLMPTIFKFTRWTFLKRPNRIIYDNEVTAPSVIDFSFDRPLHVQVSGDCDPEYKHSSVRVQLSETNYIKMAAKE